MSADATRDDAPADEPEVPVAAYWQELVTTALLGTDRRDPPDPPGPLADVVADTAAGGPTERMLAAVGATVAVRRAGVLPGRPLDALAPPAADARPPCVPAAAERWHHVTTSWPVLEDEWLLALLGNGWRAAPELVPAMLARHRSHPVRRAQALAAAGPLGPWLVEHVPDLDARGAARAAMRGTEPDRPVTGAGSPTLAESLGELPELPIPPELAALAHVPGRECGDTLAAGIAAGTLGPSHQPVLVNLLARIPPGMLDDVATALESVDPATPGHGLATVLADLARTRSRMLDELSP